MKHYYLLFVIFFTAFSINAQIVNIPDANFKDALIEVGVDINMDGEIQFTEASSVLYLSLFDKNIVSLQGIESFVNLEYLNCGRNNITELSLSTLSNLLELHCHENELTSLDVNSLTNLIELGCTSNNITDLDVSSLTNLETLYCHDNNLINLDISSLTNLERLYCNNNNLTTLDVSSLTSLQSLYCKNNNLTSIDLSSLINLEFFMCDDNQLTDLDFSSSNNLRYITCDNNQLTSLDVSSLYNLNNLSCNNNQLIYILLKNGSDLSGFEFSDNPNLQFLCIDLFELEDILFLLDYHGYDETVVVNSYCSFVPGGEFYAIQGQSLYDYNSNGCDNNDINAYNINFSITNGTSAGTIISNTSGEYFFPVQEGSHTIVPQSENLDYFIITPPSVIVEFPNDSSLFNQDFCVTPNGIHNDLEIFIIPMQSPRPGFDTDYKVIYKNKGNTTLSGTVYFDFNEPEETMSFVTSTPGHDTLENNILSWNYTDLHPFENREILITLSMNTPMDIPPLNAGDEVGFVADIYPKDIDETSNDNNFQLKETVVNSYDPNDKTCLEGATITPEKVGDYLHYLIRFENTGTANAVNIVVKDELDLTKYDVSTLIPLSGSHDFLTRVINDNVIEFIFEGIDLPFDDANNDGYVLFKLKTLNSLVIGDSLSNDAEIYFDYNFPIVTNDEITTVAALSTEEFELTNNISLYPNPTTNTLHVEANNEISSLNIFNLLGQQISGFKTNTLSTVVDLANFKSGIYLVKIVIGEQTATYKIVKD